MHQRFALVEDLVFCMADSRRPDCGGGNTQLRIRKRGRGFLSKRRARHKDGFPTLTWKTTSSSIAPQEVDNVGTTLRGRKIAHCSPRLQCPTLVAWNGPSAGRVARAVIFARHLPSQPHEDLSFILSTYPENAISGVGRGRLLAPVTQLCAAVLRFRLSTHQESFDLSNNQKTTIRMKITEIGYRQEL